MEVKVSSPDQNLSFSIKIDDFVDIEPEHIMPIINMLTSIAGALLAMISVTYLMKHQQLHFMITASYQSAMMLSMLHFQLFCVYLTLGMQFYPRFAIYSQFLTMSGICCFLASLSTNRMGVLFFLMQYANHPHIAETNWSSPKTKFYLLTNIIQITLCFVAMIISKFPIFSYYILPFYLFPMLHIVRCIQQRTKKTFIWYYQLFTWLPVISHPIFLRGYAGNYMKLTPWPALQYILVVLVMLQVEII
jgi:hypothetical protein